MADDEWKKMPTEEKTEHKVGPLNRVCNTHWLLVFLLSIPKQFLIEKTKKKTKKMFP
jgi:hypothetical protein